MNYFDGYLDEYGMITCNAVPGYPGEHSENGPLFTAIAMLSARLNGRRELEKEFDIPKLFEPCVIDGKLYRTPEPYPKPESHDNFLGWLLGAILCENETIPKRLLKMLFTKNKVVLKYVHVPILLVAKVYPWARKPMLPLIWLVAKLQRPSINEPGGAQIQLAVIYIIQSYYPTIRFYDDWLRRSDATVYDYLLKYYKMETPTVKLWRMT